MAQRKIHQSPPPRSGGHFTPGMGNNLDTGHRKPNGHKDGEENQTAECKKQNPQPRDGKISVEDVKRAIKIMNSGAAVGIDQWSPSEWKKLSPEALDAITQLFQHIEECGVWPGHIYYNII